jgi:ribosomal protein L2
LLHGFQAIRQTWLGLHDNVKTNQITLFPNPATKTIHLEGISEEDQVIVFDFQGNKCPIQRNGNNLNIESLPRGLYLISVNTKYGYFCHRLIKQ